MGQFAFWKRLIFRAHKNNEAFRAQYFALCSSLHTGQIYQETCLKLQKYVGMDDCWTIFLGRTFTQNSNDPGWVLYVVWLYFEFTTSAFRACSGSVHSAVHFEQCVTWLLVQPLSTPFFCHKTIPFFFFFFSFGSTQKLTLLIILVFKHLTFA